MKTKEKIKNKGGRPPDGIKRQTLSLLVPVNALHRFRTIARERGQSQGRVFADLVAQVLTQ